MRWLLRLLGRKHERETGRAAMARLYGNPPDLDQVWRDRDDENETQIWVLKCKEAERGRL